VRILKPVISGFCEDDMADSDSAVLLRAIGRQPTPAAVKAMSPWRFAAPLSPDMAAAREGKTIDFDALVRFCRNAIHGGEKITLIEGIGGVMVPLTERHTVLDWIAALDIPALVVVGSYLGTLSHGLTAAQALRARNISIAGVVISESEDSPVPLAETAASLARFLPGVAIRTVPRRPWADAKTDGLCDLLGNV
jgi:dethiobiotin synthetase